MVIFSIPLFFFTLTKGIKKLKKFLETHERQETQETQPVNPSVGRGFPSLGTKFQDEVEHEPPSQQRNGQG